MTFRTSALLPTLALRARRVFGLMLVTAPLAAAAHHSFRAQYDAEIVVEVTGTITEVGLDQPACALLRRGRSRQR